MAMERPLLPALPTRRQFLSVATSSAFAIPHVFTSITLAESRAAKVDVCVYGGTSGGVVAAVALAKLGRSVVLIEPTKHLGGMTSGGLGWIDYARSEDMVGGLARQWIEDMKKIYADAGIDTKKIGNAGWVCEPHVAEQLFNKWVAQHKVNVIREARLSNVSKDGQRLKSITLDKAGVDGRGAPLPEATDPGFLIVGAGIFIDCSYEGDLIGRVATCRGDREGRDEYNESAAGLRFQDTTEFGEKLTGLDPYVKPGDPSSGLIPLVSDAALGPNGSRSPVLQAYNFRLCLVKDNPIPIEAPADYDPKQFEVLARQLASVEKSGKPIKPEDFHKSPERLLKMSKIPRGKTDVNNAGAVSMDFVNGGSEKYATATWAERNKLWRSHEDYQRGMLYFLRTDKRVADDVRAEVAKWGLPRDEFKDTRGWPFQLYVRECRRLVGQYVMKQSDCEHPPGTLGDSVGLGVYSLDSHVCQRVVKDGRVIHEGGFLLRIPGPYPIAYRALIPKADDCENVMATFCVSATHVSFASIRMEPQLMVLSESAAHAAHLALKDNKSVQEIDVNKLRKVLLEAKQVLEWKKA
jgi:hypothetical protein